LAIKQLDEKMISERDQSEITFKEMKNHLEQNNRNLLSELHGLESEKIKAEKRLKVTPMEVMSNYVLGSFEGNRRKDNFRRLCKQEIQGNNNST
jgi:hypothetical protein